MSEYSMSDNTKNELTRLYYNPINTSRILCSRQHEENQRSRAEGEFQRDYARIMYSSSFRRLQGKMQLLGIKHDQFFRNRLTHSLEVAQIARSIAYDLRYASIDTYIVEAGALAHDMGNPPFGHAGERILNNLCKEIGGFEGNAQTLRILTSIEKKRSTFQGLNLTYRTLFSVVKYFKKYDNTLPPEEINKQKFIYDDDYDMLKKIKDDASINLRTLDVQIVDIADEIAYAAHDLEDGLRQKSFTIDEILHDYKSTYGESESYKKLEAIVTEKQSEISSNGKIDSTEYSKLFRKELVSSVIFTLLHDIDLVNIDEKQRSKTGTTQEKEIGFNKYAELASGLKNITFKCINHNDEVYSYEEKGKKVIESLFNIYSNSPNYLPPEYRAEEIMKQYSLDVDGHRLQQRLIADYISGMMDSYAITTYEKFMNNNFSY